MKHYLIEKGYIPLDKSWIIRMGVLDLLNGYNDTIQFLEKQESISDDLQSLYNASLDWLNGRPIHVGESGTLYRFLLYASWKLNEEKKFIIHGTLNERNICDDPIIVRYSQKKLLELDNGTSQWASAAVLLGDNERIDDAPFKLKLTYEAIESWNSKRQNNECWEPRFDETILNQANAFIEIKKRGKTEFIPEQTEDYCFSRAFGLIDSVEGEKRWSSLRGHESDRILEMEQSLEDNAADKEINSKDHRVVQAIAMLQKVENKPIKIKHPSSINKSWPQFWKFLEDLQYL